MIGCEVKVEVDVKNDNWACCYWPAGSGPAVVVAAVDVVVVVVVVIVVDVVAVVWLLLW